MRPRAAAFVQQTPKGKTMQFQKGQSGNPAGLRTRKKTTVLMQNLLEDDAEAIARKVIEMAKAGDMAAIRVRMDRLAPARRGAAVAAGDVAPAEAASLA